MDAAEKQGIVDGLLAFFGGIGVGSVGATVGWLPPGTGSGEAVLATAAVAGAIAGLQSYRRYAGLPGSNATPP